MKLSDEDLTTCLTKMQAASNTFYQLAAASGNHAFIEFCGLMNEYINLCKTAKDQGIDFTRANVHTGAHLPFQAYHKAYLNEKLACIYGVTFRINEEDQPTK